MKTQAAATVTQLPPHRRVGRVAYRLLERMSEGAYRGYQARMASRFAYI